MRLSSRLLRQEEIDALLQKYAPQEGEPGDLTLEEKDALGEIGNISMGSAATTLSTLLGRRVNITSPHVETTKREDLFGRFTVPYLAIEVHFTEGLAGSNVLIIREADAQVIADIMMGGDGTNQTGSLDEMQMSAAAEAMNQMIGAAATAMANLFGRTVTISPPQAHVFRNTGQGAAELLGLEDPVVAVSFRMTIEGLVDTTIMQIMGLETAREEAGLLLKMAGASGGQAQGAEAGSAARTAEARESPPAAEVPTGAEIPAPRTSGGTAGGEKVVPLARPRDAGKEEPSVFGPAPWAAAPQMPPVDEEKLRLLLDIPLKVSVVLGRTRRSVKEVLEMAPGSIVELDALADEPVEVLVNGVPVARGEVVVVNENFGVRITSILSPAERVQCLRK